MNVCSNTKTYIKKKFITDAVTSVIMYMAHP